MEEYLTILLDRIETANKKYLNEEITKETKKVKIDVAIKAFLFDLVKQSNYTIENILTEAKNFLTDSQLRDLKRLLNNYYVTK